MSQFVIEAHISRLWCFCSRFNRAGVSVSYPFTFLLLSAFRKTKKERKKLLRRPRKWKQQKSLVFVVEHVCVWVKSSDFVGKCQVEGRSYQSYNRFLIESPKTKEWRKNTRLPPLRCTIKRATKNDETASDDDELQYIRVWFWLSFLPPFAFCLSITRDDDGELSCLLSFRYFYESFSPLARRREAC